MRRGPIFPYIHCSHTSVDLHMHPGSTTVNLDRLGSAWCRRPLAEHLLKLHPDSNAAAKGLPKRRDWVVAQGLKVMHECKPDNLFGYRGLHPCCLTHGEQGPAA
jgi:hypothetical protein